VKRLVLVGTGPAHARVLADFAAAPPPGVELHLVRPWGPPVAAHHVLPLLAGRTELPAPDAAPGGLRVHDAAVQALDPVARRLTLAGGAVLDHDLLSVDSRLVPALDAVPGAAGRVLALQPAERLAALWPALRSLADTRALRVAVIGEGPLAVQAAFALRQGLGPALRVSLVSEGEPLAGTPAQALAPAVAALCRARGISVFTGGCRGVAEGRVQLGDGPRLACDAPVWARAGLAPAWLARAGLGGDARGRVPVLPTLQSAAQASVYVAGELAVAPDAALDAAWAERENELARALGPALSLNLRHALAGGTLQAARWPRPGPWRLDLGDGGALSASVVGRLATGLGGPLGRALCGWRLDRARARADRPLSGAGAAE
jgi:selenide,water dikinase